ncbi:hypothetical protein [Streptosporangium sp. OZ121]|uniref:hypothetical protein n=1 Tax=Streptosporangium sp. OZ121 TaxID=3444183 RepID=UPI003F7AD74E
MSTPQIPTTEDALAVVRRDLPADRTLNLGPLQINVRHSVLAGLDEAGVTEKLVSIHRAVGQDSGLVGNLTDPQLRHWLLYAANLLAVNQTGAPGFNVKEALAWLVNNVTTVRPRMPLSDRDGFELQVLGRTGWLKAALGAKVPRLPEEARQRAAACYGAPPPGAPGERPPLDRALLLKELLPRLQEFLIREVAIWRRPPGVERAFQKMSDFEMIAQLAQSVAWEMLQPYAAAREDNPFVTGFDYFKNIYDKTTAVPTENDLVRHLMTRAFQVGGQGAPGKTVFDAAGYDSTRSADNVFLFEALGKWMNEEKGAKRLTLFYAQHIGSNSHGDKGGGIGLVTEFRPDQPQSRSRWEVIETIVHEMTHSLIHPRLTAKMKGTNRPLVISEGFVEVVTREIYNWMVDHGGEKSTRRLMVGVEGALVPPIKKKDLGYGADGRYADQIFQIVGRERFLTAFLTGDVELVALPA